MENFTAIRNGLLEHVDAGLLSLADFAVYCYLHMRKNYCTGICFTNAQSISTTFRMPHSTIKDTLQKLRAAEYLDYPFGSGKRGLYPILILKDEPRDGVLFGSRLMSRADKDFHAAIYEYSSADRFEAVRLAFAHRPETVCWSFGDRLVTVPLQELRVKNLRFKS